MTIEKLNVPAEVVLEWIKLYHVHEVPSTEIAKRYGVSVSTVYRQFDSLGIRRRFYGHKYMSSTPKINKLKAYKTEVIKLYRIEKWSLAAVGKKFDVSSHTVKVALMSWNVALRRPGPVAGKRYEVLS